MKLNISFIMNQKQAIIFKNNDDKVNFNNFIKKNKKYLQNYQVFLFSGFEDQNLYKIACKLRNLEFNNFIFFKSFAESFDYYEIRKRKIIKINSFEIDLYFLKKNEDKYQFFYKNSKLIPLIYKNILKKNHNFKKDPNKNSKSVIIEKSLYIENDFKFQFKKLELILLFKDLSKLKKYILNNIGFYNLDYFFNIKIDQDYFFNFLNKVKKDQYLGLKNDLKLKIISEYQDQNNFYYLILHNYGKFLLIKDKQNNLISLEINFFEKSTVEILEAGENLKNIIEQNSNSKIRIKKNSWKNIFLILISFSILAITLWFTFGILYEGSYYNVILILQAGKYTVWLYLLIFNFFVSVFFSLVLMWIFNYTENQKFTWKNAFQWFLAAQIRFFVLEFTGNHIISLFFYSLYINRVMNISKAEIGGIIGAGFIFRGSVHLLAGIIFLSIGYGYLFSFNVNSFNMNSYIYLILGLSLGGLIFSSSFSIVSGLVVLNERIHNIYSYWYLKFKLFLNKESDYFVIYNKNEEKSLELKISSRKWLKNKKLISRIGIAIFFLFIFEGIESMGAYDLTVNYINTEYIPNNWSNWGLSGNPQDYFLTTQYNIIEFAGLRSIAKNAKDFLPFIPFGYSEYIVDGLYKVLIWEDLYQISELNNIAFETVINNNSVQDSVDLMSASTTFITMFFGKYMRLTFILFIFIWFIIYEFVWKLFKIRNIKFKTSS